MIVLHHLNFSRSTRILWLLEELQIDYRLETHERSAGFRAPDSLRSVHPFGKAPVIKDDDEVIIESAVILNYLNDKYGAGRFTPTFGTPDRVRHDQWLHWAESSAAQPLMNHLFGRLTGGFNQTLGAIVSRETTNALTYLSSDSALSPYITGDDFTLADVQISYVLALADYLDLLYAYPALVAYQSMLKSRPAYARAIAVGGPMVPPKADRSS